MRAPPAAVGVLVARIVAGARVGDAQGQAGLRVVAGAGAVHVLAVAVREAGIGAHHLHAHSAGAMPEIIYAS